jgi:hypothetical protein
MMQNYDNILRATGQKMHVRGIFCHMVKLYEILLAKLHFCGI